ncbi:MAG: hypothetical protein GWN58_39605, partial [Anaerolineae bacterium]|nr:hypothetical protein [Anaerolineae bacterium]
MTLPATSVELQFADLTGDFPAGSSNIPIASVTIEALGAGSGVIALGVVTPPGVD